MLSVSKSVNLTGSSMTEDKVIGYFSANIDESGGVSCSETISDMELYAQNKSTYRADRTEFNNMVDAVLDKREGD